MPTISGLQIPPPAHWQDFEILCCDLWRLIWNAPNTQRNGRQGQPQHGVDVYGRLDKGESWAGVQCKGKDNYTKRKLTKKELRDEVKKAKSFEPEISEFILATTGPRDAKTQEMARKITQAHRKKGLFSVHVTFWEDIVNRMADFPSVIEKHYPKKLIEVKKEVAGKPLIFIPHPYPEAPNFTGRKKERAMLTKWLLEDTEHPLLSMVAIGGMGKSALCWRWLQEEVIGEGEEKGKTGIELDGVVWWSFYERGMTFDCFIRDFAAWRWGDDTPKLKRSMYGLYNTVYQEFQQRRYLIVLDGIERILKAYHGLGSPYLRDDDKTLQKEKDYRLCIDRNADRFLEKLTTNITDSKTFLTTRLHPKVLDQLDGVLRLDLECMDPEDAVEFFHEQGVEGTRAEVERECEKYGYHSLSLRLLSGMINEDPECNSDISMCIILEKIEDVAPRKHNILELAYNALDGTKRKFVSSLAAFRAPMNYKSIKAISKYKTRKDLVAALDEVEKRGILFKSQEKNQQNKLQTIYDLHPIVRSYCYDRLRDKEAVHTTLQDYFSSMPQSDKILSLDDLAPVIELYHHTVRAGLYDKAWNLYIERLREIIQFQLCNYKLQFLLYKELIDNNNQTQIKNNGDKIRFISELSKLFYIIGFPKKTVELIDYHASAIGSISLPIFQLCYNILIDASLLLGDFQLSASYVYDIWYAQRSDDIEELGYMDSTKNFLFELPKTNSEKNKNHYNYPDFFHENQNGLPRIERYKKMIEFETFSRRRKDMQTATIQTGISLMLLYDGRTLLFSNKEKSSLKKLKESRKIFKQYEYYPGIIECNYLLTVYYIIIEDLDNASKCITRARKNVQKMGNLYSLSVRNYIKINYLSGLLHNEFAYYSKGEEQEEHLRESEKYLQSGYDYFINDDKVKRHCDGAIIECRKINLVELEASILLELAKLRHLQNRDDESKKLAAEALEIANRCSYILQQADIEQFLGEFYMDQGDVEKARKYLEDCIEHCTHCWRYSEGEPDFAYVRKEDDFYYVKKKEEWWYRPRWEKAVELMGKLERSYKYQNDIS